MKVYGNRTNHRDTGIILAQGRKQFTVNAEIALRGSLTKWLKDVKLRFRSWRWGNEGFVLPIIVVKFASDKKRFPTLLNAQLTRQIQNLDAQALEELRLFIEQLLKKQKKNALKNGQKVVGKQPLLADIERIPIPVNNIIVDRAELYDDRL